MSETVIQTKSGATHRMTADGKGTLCRPGRLPVAFEILPGVTHAVCMRCNKER